MGKEDFFENEFPRAVIAATRTESDFQAATESEVDTVFDLAPDIMTVAPRLKKAHGAGKKLFIHIDLSKGIGRDESGIKYLKFLGIDGIISTKSSMIKTARELGLITVQRFFIVDSRFIESTSDALKNAKPHMIEIMPGTVTKVISKLKATTQTPIIAGGLIETEEEVAAALLSGAAAVSTGKKELWDKYKNGG